MPAHPKKRGEVVTEASFPPGLHNAWLFATFNALSFQIVLGSPMILYAKTIGASATILGVIAGMMPLLVIFQIPAASYINRVGYKRFVYAGWGTRVMFIFTMALVPFTGAFLNEGNRLALLLALLFCFNLSRGISSCAWLPWITELVPPALRGRYLVRDAAVQNLASFVTIQIAALSLGAHPRSWQFGLVFGFSAVAGAISLGFLKRIPDVDIAEKARVSGSPIPWMAMLRFPPFRVLLHSVVAWSVAYGGMTTFTVAFLKVRSSLAEGEILFVSSAAFAGGLSSLWFLGSRLDRLGSRPVLAFSSMMWILILSGWIAISGGLLPTHLVIVIALQFGMGLFAALVGMANQRLAMAVIPAMGRNHFFALYSVLSNVSLGLAPILWGVIIDSVGQREFHFLGLLVNRYTVFFASATLVMFVTLPLIRKLHEPQAVSMEDLLRELLIASPQRVWLRLWPRG